MPPQMIGKPGPMSAAAAAPPAASAIWSGVNVTGASSWGIGSDVESVFLAMSISTHVYVRFTSAAAGIVPYAYLLDL